MTTVVSDHRSWHGASKDQSEGLPQVHINTDRREFQKPRPCAGLFSTLGPKSEGVGWHEKTLAKSTFRTFFRLGGGFFLSEAARRHKSPRGLCRVGFRSCHYNRGPLRGRPHKVAMTTRPGRLLFQSLLRFDRLFFA